MRKKKEEIIKKLESMKDDFKKHKDVTNMIDNIINRVQMSKRRIKHEKK